MFKMEKVQEITECCICTDIFTDPRILTCIHTFCLKCLEETASKTEMKNGDTMPCPLCRKSFVIPNNGMVGLQKNFFMERLLEISKLSQPSSDVILCEVCKTDILPGEETNEVPVAIQFCIQCKQNICDRCCQYHKRFQELKHHDLIPIGSSLKDVLMKNDTLQFCDLHNKKELEMYCVDCRQVICMKCFAQKHKSHNCSDIDEVAEEFREQISRDLEKMNGYETEADARFQEIVDLKLDFRQNVENMEKAIIQRGIELKELVDRSTKSLLDELSLVKQGISKEMATRQEESETHKMIINSFEKYCTELISKGSNAEVCRAANDLHSRAEELEEIHEKQIHGQISSTKVKFQASVVEDFLTNDNIVGELRGPVQSNGELSLPSGSHVRGVTKLQNKIYVLCHNPDIIRVFDDRNPYKFEKNIQIKDFKNPSDIASCEISKCLYLSESDNSCIWKVNFNDHQVTKLVINAFWRVPFKMSVTTEGLLLVVRRTEHLKQLEIYESDARLVRRISLSSGIYWPECAIQTPNGEFIIIHYDKIEGPFVLSRLSSDGQTVIARYNQEDENEELIQPCCLALDSDNHRLFVADNVNDKVMVFDSRSLILTEVLLDETNGISVPHRLCYDKMKKQLIVGHSEGHVEVYKANL